MMEMIKTQTAVMSLNPISQPACEVIQFMRNFTEAVHDGNIEEIETYYADEMESFNLPLNADWSDDTLVVDDHLATYTCKIQEGSHSDLKLTFVLDKSEGYWQIIHGEIKDCSHKH